MPSASALSCPRLAVSYWGDLKSVVEESTRLGASAVPSWHLKPESFLESHLSLAHNGILETLVRLSVEEAAAAAITIGLTCDKS